MRVLYALDSLEHGGAERHVLDVCRNAKKYGLDLIFAAFGGGSFESEFQTAGFEFLRFDRSLPVDPVLIRKLRRLFRERNIEIAHGFQPIEALHLYLASVGTGVKCVQTHQGFLSGKKNRLAGRLVTPLMDANISVSESLLPWLAAEMGLNTKKDFFVAYNTVDPTRLRITPKNLRAEFGNPELLCGMVANFHPDPTKDQMTVCRALPHVFAEIEDAVFVFVGRVSKDAEPYFEDCVSYCTELGIEDRVFFTGERNDVPDILNSLDLFVFSSLVEGLPVAVIEAMLLEVPLIVSDIEPLLEVTGSGNFARVFKTGDPDELASRMIELMGSAQKRKTLASEARVFALNKFGLDAHFKQLLSIYKSLR